MIHETVRVAADLGCIVPGESGGLVSVVAGTLDELFERRPNFEFVVFCTPQSRDLLRVDLPNVEVVTLASGDFYEELERRLATQPIDVLFRAYPTLERLSFPSERQIVLIPDLFHELRPEFFDPQVLSNRRDSFRHSFKGVGAIATISRYARSMIEREPGRGGDVFVMYPAVPSGFAASNSADATAEERALVPDDDFFFYPANLWPHKNHERLFQAVRRYRELTGSPAGLVLTGALDGSQQLLDRHGDVPARHLGYVRPPLLRLLYERATALTFFSLHEGFGIPVLEAFEAGTPVLCSNCSSLPEVAGDAALMCDPEDVEAMAGLMVEIASSPGLRALLVRRGKEQLERFSWGSAADQLGRAIERVIPQA